MYSRGCIQESRFFMRQPSGFLVAFITTAGHDDPLDAGTDCAFQHVVAIIVETVVRQVGANVYE